jgi:hypothetical protein
MDLALGHIDFVEVFQFGVLKTKEWYQLLNAGLQVTGIAGSDFPVPLMRLKPWPRWIPLLGPERTLVKTKTAAGGGYDAWSAGVRSGNVIVTNGPLVEINYDSSSSTATASARFFRPLKRLEIIRNGQIVASASGGGKATTLTASVSLPGAESCWVAAHVTAKKELGEPEIQAHTNPVYVTRDGKPAMVPGAREELAARWASEIAWYQAAGLVFHSETERQAFFHEAEQALAELRRSFVQ